MQRHSDFVAEEFFLIFSRNKNPNLNHTISGTWLFLAHFFFDLGDRLKKLKVFLISALSSICINIDQFPKLDTGKSKLVKL